MKHVCIRCGRESSDGNLWCQEVDCPAEDKPSVFDFDHWLGDVQVIRPLRVLRSATLYEARQGEADVFLKVAHPWSEHLLRQEAEILCQGQSSNNKAAHPMLPRLLPAYKQSSLQDHPMGTAIVSGETYSYSLFAPIEGQFLRDRLLKNPQPWHEHAAWLTLGLAEVLAYLHSRRRCLHLALSPDMILVREDAGGVLRPILMDLGLMILETTPQHLEWLHDHGHPAYTAPELSYASDEDLSSCQPATPASDVYGLGLIFYEMLVGAPAIPYEHRRPAEVRQAVRRLQPPAPARSDLPQTVGRLVERAIHKVPGERFADIFQFAAELRSIFGPAPREKAPRSLGQRLTVLAVAGVALFSLIVLLVALRG